MAHNPAPEQYHFRFPTLSIIVWLSGGAALFFSSHNKLISAAAAAIGGVLWTASVGLTSKIWAHVEKTIVEVVGNALDVYIRDFASRYRKRYLEHLQHRHRTFDVKGLSTQGIYALEIEQVYVELTVDPTLVGKASANPIAKIEGGRHNIWTFLNSPQMKQQDFAILGAPGSGKTTLLKHITLGLAANNGNFQGVKRLPVLLFIRDHAASIAAALDKSIASIAEEAATKMGIPSPAGWFGRELARGRCLIMLDGLDEVADSNLRKTVAEWVEIQLQAFGANRFLISSRPFGYKSNPLSNVTVLEVRPFSLEQSKRFIKNWYLSTEIMSAQKNDEGVHISAREGADDLLKRIRSSPALAELAVNPLLLTMIANVHRYRSSLPGRRVELYAEICEVFLGKRQQARGIEQDLTPPQKKRVLQPLAYHMMRTERREIHISEAVKVISDALALVNARIPPESFLRNIENSSGLMVEREIDIYGFAHLTFQEYLAASYIFEESLEEELTARVDNTWWHETIRLYVAMAEATGIVEACIRNNELDVVKLSLAVECLEEAIAVRPDLRTRVETILVQGLEDPSPERAALAAEIMLALRLRRLTRIDDDTYVDSGLISCAEYQLFINSRLTAGDYRQPDHWQKMHFASGTARHPIMGVRLSDAQEFCRWLTKREGNEDWVYEIPGSNLKDIFQGQKGYWAKTEGGPGLYGLSDMRTTLDLQLFRARLAADIQLLKAHSFTPLKASIELFDSPWSDALTLDHLQQTASTIDVGLVLKVCSGSGYLFVPERNHIMVFEGVLNFDELLTVSSDFLSEIVFSFTTGINRVLSGPSRPLARAITRLRILTMIEFLKFRKPKNSPWYSRLLRRKSHFYNARDVKHLFQIYFSLAILDERTDSNLPALESIRIMKSRKVTLGDFSASGKVWDVETKRS